MPWTTARNRVELGAPVVGGERQRLPASAQGALSAWDIRPGQAFTAVAPNGAWWRMRRLDGADLPELLPIEPITNPEPPSRLFWPPHWPIKTGWSGLSKRRWSAAPPP